MKACIDCGRIVRDVIHGPGNNRCALHRAERSAQQRGRYGTRQQRGYTQEYMRARREVLAGATHCDICGRQATEADPLVADHIVPINAGGTHDLSNLRPAHSSCNRARVRREHRAA